MPSEQLQGVQQGVQQGVVTAAQLDNIIDIHVVVGARVNPMSGGCIVVRSSPAGSYHPPPAP